jgi:hypothetical protein
LQQRLVLVHLRLVNLRLFSNNIFQLHFGFYFSWLSDMLQFAPLGCLGSTKLSIRRASALPPQFHRVWHLLFSIAYDSGTALPPQFHRV